MSWNFFTNTGSLKTSGQIAAGVSTVASGSAIAVNPGYTILLTGTTAVNTMTGGVTGGVVRLIASAQATGVCVVLNNAATSNALSLRDSANFGIYAGESVTFVYNGTYWVEVSRNTKNVLVYVEGTSNVNITATTAGTANTIVTATAFTSDGVTPMDVTYFAAAIDTPNTVNGTVSLILYEDGTNRGHIGDSPGIQNSRFGFGTYVTRLTPASGSRTYSMRGYVNGATGVIQAGAGTTTTYTPTFIKITRSL